MSARKRSLRSNRFRKSRRVWPSLLEDLETRLVLSQSVLPVGPTPIPGATSAEHLSTAEEARLLHEIDAEPGAQMKMVAAPAGGFVPDQSGGPEGYSPQQLTTAYGINLVNFGGIVGSGAGQTIAVIDAGNNTGFQPTGPKYAGSALQVFDQTFGLPDPPSFEMYNQTGGTALPAPVTGWGTEISLDIEWAHSIAPLAKLEIVEGTSASLAALFTAAETAVTKLGASVVSMSFGLDLEYLGDGSLEPYIDQTYFQPALAANPYVTYLASTGDSGAKPGDGPNYPAVSPLVVGVGGTTLNLTKTNEWASETGWSYGSDSYAPSAASSGGISNEYPEPPWQVGYQSTGFRTIPDVSSDADPNTGVSVYDPADFGTSTPWVVVGGTSLSSPTWAGIIAMADQGRVLNGLEPLDGPNQTLPALYALPASDFHDITVGYNYYNAGPGYDLVTGRGSPVGNKLIPDLSNYGAPTSAIIAYEPPSTVSAGGVFGTLVEALDADGAISVGYSAMATISLLSGPAGVTFTPVTEPVTNGTGLLDGLTLNVQSSGTPYVFKIVIGTSSGVFATLDTTGVTVTAPASTGTGVFYPVPVDQSIRNDFTMGEADSNSIDNYLLVYNADYEISQGQIVLQNNSAMPNKTIEVSGMGEGQSVVTADGTSRDFDILGLNSSGFDDLTVMFQNLTIAGGLARDNGGLVIPTSSGVGGGVLMDGGLVTMSKVSFKDNKAEGGTGATGFLGASRTGGPGGPGGAGGAGQGGAIYLAAGVLTLKDDMITGNTAAGGFGGEGGTGGLAGTLTIFGSFYFGRQIPGGVGGTGGGGLGPGWRPLRQRRQSLDLGRNAQRQ